MVKTKKLVKAQNGEFIDWNKIKANLNPLNWMVDDYTSSGSFSKAYEAAKKSGKKEFIWNNKRFSTEYAGTPRQEVGRYGINGQPVNKKALNDPAQVNLYPLFHKKYLPGHISASIADNKVSIDYSASGNDPLGLSRTSKKRGEKSFYVYGQDNLKFVDKATSLPMKDYLQIALEDKKDSQITPSTWNLLTNNCADNVCDAFDIKRSIGIETPNSALKKIKNKYPTLEVTGRTTEDYKTINERLLTFLNSERESIVSPESILQNSDKLLSIYYSPDTGKDFKKTIATALQKSLFKKGKELPKSSSNSSINQFDGIIGPETMLKLTEWKNENSVKKDVKKLQQGGVSGITTPLYGEIGNLLKGLTSNVNSLDYLKPKQQLAPWGDAVSSQYVEKLKQEMGLKKDPHFFGIFGTRWVDSSGKKYTEDDLKALAGQRYDQDKAGVQGFNEQLPLANSMAMLFDIQQKEMDSAQNTKTNINDVEYSNASPWPVGFSMQNGGQPTKQDSLDLYNNAIKVLNYYGNNSRYRKEKSRVLPTYEKKATHYWNSRQAESIEDGSTYREANTDAILPLTKEFYRKEVDKNKYYQREAANFVLNSKSPMQLFDQRILPPIGLGYQDISSGDYVDIYSYEPLLVKPVSMLTDKERKRRAELEKYYEITKDDDVTTLNTKVSNKLQEVQNKKPKERNKIDIQALERIKALLFTDNKVQDLPQIDLVDRNQGLSDFGRDTTEIPNIKVLYDQKTKKPIFYENSLGQRVPYSEKLTKDFQYPGMFKEGGMPDRYKKLGFTKVNSPKRTPGHDSKSHAVVVKDGGDYKLIRFGQQGVSGSPKKEGESESYANRRKSFKARHAKNIAKGKTSAAYWADKVKWEQGGEINSEQQLLGYKDNSPYKNLPFQVFNTDVLTMDGVSKPILAVSDSGEKRVLPPNSGLHKFNGAKSIMEFPVKAQDGGDVSPIVEPEVLPPLPWENGLVEQMPIKKMKPGVNFYYDAKSVEDMNSALDFRDFQKQILMPIKSLGSLINSDLIVTASYISEALGYDRNEVMPFLMTHQTKDNPLFDIHGTKEDLKKANLKIEKLLKDNFKIKHNSDGTRTTMPRNSVVDHERLKAFVNSNPELSMMISEYKNGGKVKSYKNGGMVTNYSVNYKKDLPVGNSDVPKGVILLDSLVPIQTEKGELILTPTGDVVPVNATKRHHQMSDDEVTDLSPDKSYIFSKYGDVKIHKPLAEKMVTGVTNKPYNVFGKNPQPQTTTLADFMTKKVMAPADVVKNVINKYKVVDNEGDLFTEETNRQNRINRAPLLEAVMSLSELDKEMKGLNTVEQFKQGGFLKQGINKYQTGAEVSAIAGAGSSVVSSVATLISDFFNRKALATSQEKSVRDVNELYGQQSQLSNLGMLAGLTGVAAQNPTIDPVTQSSTYLDQIPQSLPRQFYDYNTARLYANKPNFSMYPPQVAAALMDSFYAKTQDAQSAYAMNAAVDGTNRKTSYFQAKQALLNSNEANKTNALNLTRANSNNLIATAAGIVSGNMTDRSNLLANKANALLAIRGQGVGAFMQMNNQFAQSLANNAATAAQAVNSYANSTAPKAPMFPNLPSFQYVQQPGISFGNNTGYNFFDTSTWKPR